MSIFGRLVYKLYYEPKQKQATIKKFGGQKSYLAMQEAEQEMKSYALNDLVITANFNTQGKYKLNFLTGDDFLHQTLFCTYSLFRFLSWDESSMFSVNFYSDGSLGNSSIEILKARFPRIRVIDYKETMLAIRDLLPSAAFPYLNKKIRTLPLFKKLIFTHLNNKGSSTFLDSDMLFLEKPLAFLDWLYNKSTDANCAFCIQDIQRSYGYTDDEILKVWATPIKHNINSGMYSLHSEKMDFQMIEFLVKEFEEKFGSQYYIEQLITAIILETSEKLFVASKSEYIVLPSYDQIMKQAGVLHHYVNESKQYYFKESWRRQIRSN
ncbi:MAG: glycosyl transferase family protein [Sphingobacteriales bacterium]|nr:glycosyl transferase family protein [Sphingobacteriales bacterium]